MSTRAFSWLIAGLTVVALVAALVLLGLNARVMTRWLAFELALTFAALLYAGAGRLIISRVPGNAVGWLLATSGLLLAATMLSEQYTVYGLVTAPGALPAVRPVGWFSAALEIVTVFLLLFAIVLFPDGRPPSRRWRPLLWLIAICLAGAVAGQMQAGKLIDGLTDVLDQAGAEYPNPLGIFPRHGWFSGLVGTAYILAMAATLLAVASVFARWRAADTERRKQVAWLGYVGLLTVTWLTGTGVSSAFTGGNGLVANVLYLLLVLTPAVGIPVACVVAVLKYRLYDIDRLISRTVSYAIVTGLLIGVYAALVLVSSAVLPRHDAVAVAAATLIAAALFSPLRRRVQHVVDRRFNRSRYDAELMTAAFAARLQDATELAAVQADLAATVDRALQPAHLSVWLTN
jgi:hypothetical protein